MIYESDFYHSAVIYTAKHLAFNHINVFWGGVWVFWCLFLAFALAKHIFHSSFVFCFFPFSQAYFLSSNFDFSHALLKGQSSHWDSPNSKIFNCCIYKWTTNGIENIYVGNHIICILSSSLTVLFRLSNKHLPIPCTEVVTVQSNTDVNHDIFSLRGMAISKGGSMHLSRSRISPEL